MGRTGKRNAWRRKRTVVLARDEYTCQYCLVPFPEDQLTLDHVLPRYRGGTYAHWNLVAACAACQQRKDSKTINQINIPDWQRELLKPEALQHKMRAMDFTEVYEKVRAISASTIGGCNDLSALCNGSSYRPAECTGHPISHLQVENPQ